MISVADAVAAFRQALSSFRRSIFDYAIYSLVTSLVGAVMGTIVAIAIIAFGFVSVGTLASLVAEGNALSLQAAGMALVLLVMLAGLLIFMLIQSGFTGAYLETVSGFLAGRKQSLYGFASSVPRHAGRMLAATLLSGIIASLPAAAGLAVALALGISSVAGIAVAALGICVSAFISLLFLFVQPAAAVDRRGALDALKSSLGHVVRSPAGFVVFLVLSAILFVPAAIPLLNVVYVPFFLMPVWSAALVAFYKQ